MDFNQMDEDYDDENQSFHYYYNREERISHAPKIVQEHYNGNGPQLPKGIFRSLVGSSFNRIILITLLAVMVIGFFVSRNAPDAWEKDIGDVTATLTAFSYVDSVYAAVAFSPKSSSKNKAQQNLEQTTPFSAVPIEISFSCLDENGNVISSDKISSVYNGKEIAVRTEFTDYDIVSVKAEISVNGTDETLAKKVEKH